MKHRWFVILVFALAMLVSTVCKSSTSTTPSDTPKDDPSFSGDIQPIFSASCAVSGCHNSSAQAGMNLSSGQAYNNTVNVASTQDSAKKRVLPNDAAQSYIIIKLEGRQSVGAKMPQGGSLTGTQIQNIKNWIDKGAKNN